MLLRDFVYPVQKIVALSSCLNVVLKLTLENICIYRNMTGYKNRKYREAEKKKTSYAPEFPFGVCPFSSNLRIRRILARTKKSF